MARRIICTQKWCFSKLHTIHDAQNCDKGAHEKDRTAMGHCLRNIAITYGHELPIGGVALMASRHPNTVLSKRHCMHGLAVDTLQNHHKEQSDQSLIREEMRWVSHKPHE
jgi:hypothetical protein